MNKYPKRKPDFENKKFKVWTGKKVSKNQKTLVNIDLDKEKLFQTRTYPLKIGADIKILSKQNLKTGKIEAVILKQTGKLKKIFGYVSFEDENDYGKQIKSLEIGLATTFGLETNKVLITTQKEFEKIANKLKKQKKYEKK